MSRYEEATDSMYNLLDSIIDERFGNLRATKIRILLDSKPKIDKLNNRMTFAYIKLTNEVEKFLTTDGHNLNGIDYIMFLNSLVWELADDKDKRRILSHELQHIFIDEKGNYKVIKHDIEDFYAEVEFNKDDPMWGQALSTVAIAKLEQIKAEEKANRS